MTVTTDPAHLDVVLVLTEAPLTEADVEHLVDVYRDPDADGRGSPVAFHVIAPTTRGRRLLPTLLDHLGMLDLADAWDDVTGRDVDPLESVVAATRTCDASMAALHDAGVAVDGEVVDGDPIPVLDARVAAGGVREVAVLTYPHPVEDTLHKDWASQARERLAIPVLHLYLGTSELG
jgi:hypothetical protein